VGVHSCIDGWKMIGAKRQKSRGIGRVKCDFSEAEIIKFLTLESCLGRSSLSLSLFF